MGRRPPSGHRHGLEAPGELPHPDSGLNQTKPRSQREHSPASRRSFPSPKATSHLHLCPAGKSSPPLLTQPSWSSPQPTTQLYAQLRPELLLLRPLLALPPSHSSPLPPYKDTSTFCHWAGTPLRQQVSTVFASAAVNWASGLTAHTAPLWTVLVMRMGDLQEGGPC